jgi:hypothetical protein
MLTITNYYFLHKKNTKLTRSLGHGDYIAPQGCLKKIHNIFRSGQVSNQQVMN